MPEEEKKEEAPEETPEETPETEEKKEGEEQPPEEDGEQPDQKEEEPEEPEGDVKDKIQERFDALSAEIHDLKSSLKDKDEIIESIKSRGKKENTWEDYSDKELIALKNEHPEYTSTVDELLLSRMEDRVTGKVAAQTSYEKRVGQALVDTKTEFGDAYLTPGTKEHSLAKSIYESLNLASHPDGTYLAAMKANNILGKGKKAATGVIKKRLDKEQAKKELAGGTRVKGTPTLQSQVDKQYEIASKSGNDSGNPEWRKYLKLSRELKASKGAK